MPRVARIVVPDRPHRNIGDGPGVFRASASGTEAETHAEISIMSPEPLWGARRFLPFVFLAAVLAVWGAGCGNGNGLARHELPRHGEARTFNSDLPLRVYVVAHDETAPEFLGKTPAAEPIMIPAQVSWFVRPRQGVKMRAIAKEIASKGILGLQLERAGDADLAHLKGLTELRELNLNYTMITDAGLAHLAGLTGLRELNLLACQNITDAGLARLGRLTALQKLDLSWCTKITAAGLKHLKGLTGLRILKLRWTQVADGSLAHLQNLTNLRELDLSWCPNITDAGLQHLQGLVKLHALRLGSRDENDGMAYALSGNYRETEVTPPTKVALSIYRT
jgi:hypothetical protein